MIAIVEPSEALITAADPRILMAGTGCTRCSTARDGHPCRLGHRTGRHRHPQLQDLPESEAGHDEALGMRYDFLVELARRTQQSIVDQAVKSGDLDLTGLSDDATTALFCDRTRPFEGLAGADGQWTHHWDLAAPLVLIATDYQPYTHRPTPNGRIVWLDPSTEPSFLRSLDTLGIIELRVLV